MGTIRLGLIGAFVALLGSAAPRAELAEAHDAREYERAFVMAINEVREQQGVPTLTVHPSLESKARTWARSMSHKMQILHSDLEDGIDVDWWRLGENVGRGGSVDAIHEAFVGSRSHYENFVDPEFEFVGVGVALVAGGMYVAQEFMDPSAQHRLADTQLISVLSRLRLFDGSAPLL